MKTSNSSAGWRRTSRRLLFTLVFMLGACLLVGTAWGDDGREHRQSGERRRDFNARAEHWRELPPERQGELRRRYEQFRQLPPEQQTRIRQEYQRFRQLPDDERRAVKEHWRQLSPAERREYRQKLRERGY